MKRFKISFFSLQQKAGKKLLQSENLQNTGCPVFLKKISIAKFTHFFDRFL